MQISITRRCRIHSPGAAAFAAMTASIHAKIVSADAFSDDMSRDLVRHQFFLPVTRQVAAVPEEIALVGDTSEANSVIASGLGESK